MYNVDRLSLRVLFSIVSFCLVGLIKAAMYLIPSRKHSIDSKNYTKYLYIYIYTYDYFDCNCKRV